MDKWWKDVDVEENEEENITQQDVKYQMMEEMFDINYEDKGNYCNKYSSRDDKLIY